MIEKIALWVIAALVAAFALTILPAAYVGHKVSAMLPSVHSDTFEYKTPVMYPEFYQLVEGYAGQAKPASHQYGPVSFAQKDDCQAALTQRPHPENYYCLKYESAKTIDYTFPETF